MKVTKMHGARNDFVIVDRRSDGRADLVRFARWACDRRAGIGADGVIAIESSSVADARMRTINADGSEAEMCGNGIRCAARWLDEAGEGAGITFETEAGLIPTEIVSRGAEYAVRVAMGRPRVTPLDDRGGWFVDLGNPHVVLVRSSVEGVDLESIAEQFQADSRFPDGTNVHVVALQDQRTIRVAHWERGVGSTMACGTGAVACAAVAIASGTATSPVEVFVPGGRLVVEWDGTGNAYLTGPAVRVFDTEVDLGDELAS
ncbi:MAG TPA: diaminopimelate epimerase [Candidatus Acidoferrum sp.]|jgi:diaminopimelate epimerase|nr:diaminopimelate epimerase [Candidatus Acidoferrum sp.]